MNICIEGYFASTKTANETVAKLKESGYKEAFVDMNEHYNEDRNVQRNIAGTETAMSLSGLVLDSGAHGISRDKAPFSFRCPFQLPQLWLCISVYVWM